MKRNSLLQKTLGNHVELYRILDIQGEKAFVIDCLKANMPKWVAMEHLEGFEDCEESVLYELSNYLLPDKELLDASRKRVMYERFTLIAGILPFVENKKRRNELITELVKGNGVCKQTIRNYLCLYLVYQDISALAPKAKEEKELTDDEKKMRYAINKYYFSKNKNSLNTAFTMMLQNQYCDENKKLLPEHPSFNQFRYFYQKYRKWQTFYISRNGIKDYQRNYRPLVGDMQEYASHVGIAQFDATVLDIYLVDEAGKVCGRPLLIAAVDTFSSLCIGYHLCWEGGVYSLRGLMLNIIADKVEHCRKHGILIDKAEWDSQKLPAEFITDRGSEFISSTFENIVELGVKIESLASYRAELKGHIERFFRSVQDLFKPYLKGKGVIEDDWQERGSHDYRKDACITIEQMEKIIIRCILFYNNKRTLENYPYTEDMLSAQVQPFASGIWKYGKAQTGANLIDADAKTLILTLLPRTEAKFSRFGLKVNKMRYHCEGFTERYLKGDACIVAYNPDDVSMVWLFENGEYTQFDLIESRFRGKTLAEVESMQDNQKELVKGVGEENLQAKIDLAEHIQAISGEADTQGNKSIKGIRKTRQREQDRTHTDFMKEVDFGE